MISNKDYQYIEMTRSFALNAADFKIGNAKDENVKKIKQHKRIEDAILTYFPHVKTIEDNLSPQDIKLVKEYEKCGFCLGEVAMLCREISLQTAIAAYVFDNGGSLDSVSAELMGLQYKEKEIFETNEDVKEIIRLDASGYIANHFFNGKPLSSSYSREINDESKYQLVGGIGVSKKRKGHTTNGKRTSKKSERVVGGQKILRQGLPEYQSSEYDLNESPRWKNIFSKFENFREIQGNIVSCLQKYSVNPKVVKDMKIADFKDIIFKAFSSRKDDDIVNPFMGSVSKRVRGILEAKENQDAMKKYLLFCRNSEESAAYKVATARLQGVLFGDLSNHHIVHVSNAGEHIDYNKINDADNLVTVSPFMHRLIHSSDHQHSNSVYGLFPEKGKYDLMLSITPIFRTAYSGEKTSEVENNLIGEKDCLAR